MAVKPWLLIVALLALTGCDDLSKALKAQPRRPLPPPPLPLALPPADGRTAQIMIGDGYTYLVLYQRLDQARGKVYLRISRQTAPELDYSDGLVAKRVAQSYCGQYNRPLNPVAGGKFSQPNAWMFEGGCG